MSLQNATLFARKTLRLAALNKGEFVRSGGSVKRQISASYPLYIIFSLSGDLHFLPYPYISATILPEYG
jgi:hypothetical protein